QSSPCPAHDQDGFILVSHTSAALLYRFKTEVPSQKGCAHGDAIAGHLPVPL
ncbi:unnamed protein product, partial [Symbiodinium sp. CCMP2456]